MGRNSIRISYIEDDRTRNMTFNKRKHGLLKKATELSVLCNIKIVLFFTDQYGNVYNFFSPDDSALDVIKKSHENQNVYKVNAEDYPHFYTREAPNPEDFLNPNYDTTKEKPPNHLLKERLNQYDMEKKKKKEEKLKQKTNIQKQDILEEKQAVPALQKLIDIGNNLKELVDSSKITLPDSSRSEFVSSYQDQGKSSEESLPSKKIQNIPINEINEKIEVKEEKEEYLSSEEEPINKQMCPIYMPQYQLMPIQMPYPQVMLAPPGYQNVQRQPIAYFQPIIRNQNYQAP